MIYLQTLQKHPAISRRELRQNSLQHVNVINDLGENLPVFQTGDEGSIPSARSTPQRGLLLWVASPALTRPEAQAALQKIRQLLAARECSRRSRFYLFTSSKRRVNKSLPADSNFTDLQTLVFNLFLTLTNGDSCE